MVSRLIWAWSTYQRPTYMCILSHIHCKYIHTCMYYDWHKQNNTIWLPFAKHVIIIIIHGKVCVCLCHLLSMPGIIWMSVWESPPPLPLPFRFTLHITKHHASSNPQKSFRKYQNVFCSCSVLLLPSVQNSLQNLHTLSSKPSSRLSSSGRSFHKPR